MTGSISRIVTHLKHMEPIATITSHYNNSAASVVEVYVGFTQERTRSDWDVCFGESTLAFVVS